MPSNSFGVVIVNWNGASDTIRCVESLWTANPRPFHVVVVDNGSRDASASEISSWASHAGIDTAQILPGESQDSGSWLTLIMAGDNRGFAGGNNVGIEFLARQTDISHVLLLNNDATVAPDFFVELDRALQLRPDAGLLTGTIYEDPQRDKVWYAGGREIRSRALIAHLDTVPTRRTPVDTEFISGCAMLISRDALKSVGMLADCYFPLYMEDAEYSLRVREQGMPVLYAPAAKVYHRIGATVGKAETSPFIARAQVRHRVLYVRRNFRRLQRVVALTYLAVTKPGKAIVETISGRPKMGWAVLRGMIEGFTYRG